MNITQRNFAITRVAAIYHAKFQELSARDKKLHAQYNETNVVTVAEVLTAFKANNIKGIANPKLDAPCERLTQVFDISHLKAQARVKADSVTTLLRDSEDKVDSEQVKFAGYKGSYTTYNYFYTQKCFDAAIALNTSFDTVVDAIMLGDAAVAQVAIERAQLASF